MGELLVGCRSPNGPKGALTELWFHAQPGFTRTRPVVVGDVVVFGSGSGALVARDVVTGTQRWATPVASAGGVLGDKFAVAGGAVIAACEREVVAVELGTGLVRWRYQPPLDTTYDGLPGGVASSDLATDGTDVYVPAWGASVSAVSVATGVTRWVWALGRLQTDTAVNVFRSGATGAAVGGDTLFVTVWHLTNLLGGTRESLFVALDRATGAELWKIVLPQPGSGGAVNAAPLLFADLAAVLTIDGRLYAVRRSTGAIAWQYRSPAYASGTLAAPAVVGNTIYATMGDEMLTALRADDGSVLWSVPPMDAVRDLLATDRRIYVPRDGLLNIHDRGTGALVATGRVNGPNGGAFTTAAAARGDQIFITTSEGAWSFREPE